MEGCYRQRSASAQRGEIIKVMRRLAVTFDDVPASRVVIIA